MLANPYQKYMQNQVETVSPQQLILLLYNGAIKFVRLAQSGLEENNIEKGHKNIVKTQDILLELMNSLDLEQGAVATNLYMLYEFMYTHLVEANLQKDKQKLAAVESMLCELRDTWTEALRLVQ